MCVRHESQYAFVLKPTNIVTDINTTASTYFLPIKWLYFCFSPHRTTYLSHSSQLNLVTHTTTFSTPMWPSDWHLAPLTTAPKSFRTSAHAGLFLACFPLPSHSHCWCPRLNSALHLPCGYTYTCRHHLGGTGPSVESGQVTLLLHKNFCNLSRATPSISYTVGNNVGFVY